MENIKPRITVRLLPHQLLILEELKDTLNCSVSMIVRTIVGDFLSRNEEVLERIITGEQEFDKNWLYDDDNTAISR